MLQARGISFFTCRFNCTISANPTYHPIKLSVESGAVEISTCVNPSSTFLILSLSFPSTSLPRTHLNSCKSFVPYKNLGKSIHPDAKSETLVFAIFSILRHVKPPPVAWTTGPLIDTSKQALPFLPAEPNPLSYPTNPQIRQLRGNYRAWRLIHASVREALYPGLAHRWETQIAINKTSAQSPCLNTSYTMERPARLSIYIYNRYPSPEGGRTG